MQEKVYISQLCSLNILMEPDVQEVSIGLDIKEECTSDQNLSKIPRFSKPGALKKKQHTELDRPSSAKSFIVLENKYKASMAKYLKELKEMHSQNEKLVFLRETIIRIISEMKDKGKIDLPAIPDEPSAVILATSRNLRNQSITSSLVEKQRKLELNEMLDVSKKRSIIDTADAIEVFVKDMPNLEQTIQNLEEALNLAHGKQNDLELKLDGYKDDISNIMDDYENVSSIKRTSELLIQELENIKEEFQKERSVFKKEIEAKDEELKRARASYTAEYSKRKAIEDDYLTLQKEREQLKEDCEEYNRQIEKLQKMQTLVPSAIGGVQDLAIQNGQLQYEVDELQTKLTLSQKRLLSMTDENELHKQEVRKLMVEREEIKTEFLNHCQQILFEKENQIYSIKSKMDAIVNLKNSMVTKEGKGEPCFSIDMVMNINDTNTLKKELVGMHNKLISFEDTRTDLERRLSTKDVAIQDLEEELATKCQNLNKMESLLEIMKKKDRDNIEILSSLEISSEYADKLMEHGSKEEKLKELVRWQENQREMVAELEKDLKTSAERFILSEERRIRNEERIAMLQHQLAKYQYFR